MEPQNAEGPQELRLLRSKKIAGVQFLQLEKAEYSYPVKDISAGNSPRLVDGLEILASIIDPDIFGDRFTKGREEWFNCQMLIKCLMQNFCR